MTGAKRQGCLTAGQLVILGLRERGESVSEIARMRQVSVQAVYRAMARAADALNEAQEQLAEVGLDTAVVDNMLKSILN